MSMGSAIVWAATTVPKATRRIQYPSRIATLLVARTSVRCYPEPDSRFYE
jgi:hypothetical protein